MIPRISFSSNRKIDPSSPKAIVSNISWNRLVGVLLILELLISCEEKDPEFYVGGDLSYLNEMIDCGGEFRVDNKLKNPFEIFGEKGANLSRIRLWNDPDWTDYSDLNDVIKSIKRSKGAGMSVLLDFHYSDDWADPQKQIIPKAWRDIMDIRILSDSVYEFTFRTLVTLESLNLTPEMVQIGNETNIEILQQQDSMRLEVTDWKRNVTLLNAGLKAVFDFNEQHETKIETMLHIAQPENALWWFPDAQKAGIEDFDWVGLSYYPKWSKIGLDQVSSALNSIKKITGKKMMIVETAYPHGFYSTDQANNIMGEDAIIAKYSATPDGQRNYMIDLTQLVLESGGQGVIYWEPGWISTNCSTRWGQGSHWENVTFFDGQNGNDALPVFDYMTYEYE